MHQFNKEFFTKNRNRLRATSDESLIVLSANSALQKSADTTFPFKQDTSFWYFTGLHLQDVVLVIDGKDEYLILPPRSEVQDIFDGLVVEKEISETSGITTIFAYDDGWKKLGAKLKRQQSVATLKPMPEYVDIYGFYTNPARMKLKERMREFNAKLELSDVRALVATLRSVKQPSELKAIQSAIDVTATGLAAVREQLPKLRHEYEIEAILSYHFRRTGASGHAFDPIVAGGRKACQIHPVANNAALNKGELIVVDVGAEYQNYAADITRTVAFGEPSKRQKEIYSAVKEVQDYAYQQLKPGLTIRESETLVEKKMGEVLKRLKLIKTTERNEIRRFYPHSTSHFLGLDVHDIGNYDAPLLENMVLTVEPGIYIADEGIGVRIEDDVRITKTGIEVLSASIPTEL